MRAVSTLKTESFTLRPLKRSDAGALLPTLSDREQCLYLTRAAFGSEQELWDWLAAPDWNGRTWIAEDADGQVAGRFVAMPAHEAGVEEIGYITCVGRQGQGVARECMAAVIDLLFGEGLRKLIAVVDVENSASARLAESLGFAREAHFRAHETTHEGVRDVYWYGLLASDWG
jgi:RimJ/RimL family protein N-acetyltransferase